MPSARHVLSLCSLALTCTFSPARAVTHEQSGVTIPDQFDGMAVEVTTGGNFGPFAQLYTFGNGPDRIEIAVVKPAHPNASVWFKDNQWRAEKLLSAGHPKVSEPQKISIASTVLNGLKALIEFDAHYKSAGVATVGFGDWVVNVLSVSKEMTAEDQRKRLDRLIGQIHPEAIQTKYPPIADIGHCPADAPAMFYFPVSETPPDHVSLQAATVAGLVAVRASSAASLGQPDSLGTTPEKYCWSASVSGLTKWFRPITPSNSMLWLSTVAGTGWTIESWPVPKVPGSEEGEFALIGNDFERTVVSQLYQHMPNPTQTLSTGMLSLIAPPRIAYVKRGTNEVVIVGPK